MQPNPAIAAIETLLKSGTEENIQLALLTAQTQQLDYDVYAFAELAFFLAQYEPINPHQPLEAIIRQIVGYGWYELEQRGIVELPACFGRFLNLRTLHLESNELTSLPDSFAQLTELKKLYLGGNPFQQLPLVVCQLPKLELLDIPYAQLSSLPPIEIAQLKQLKQLNLRENPIPTTELERIKTLLPHTEILV